MTQPNPGTPDFELNHQFPVRFLKREARTFSADSFEIEPRIVYRDLFVGLLNHWRDAYHPNENGLAVTYLLTRIEIGGP